MTESTTPGPLYRFYHSAILAAPLPQVWAELRDFSRTLEICFGAGVSHIKWLGHGSAEHIPAPITFTLEPAGLRIEEEVVARSETEHSLSYRTVGQALSFASYVATFTLRPITTSPGSTFVEWSRDFSLTPDTNPAEFIPFYAQLVDQEFASLVGYFAAK
jgi:hypothetical protein